MQPMRSHGYNPLFASLLGTGMQKSDSISSVYDGRVTSSFYLQVWLKEGRQAKMQQMMQQQEE
jgi:hypothetical protein